MNQNGSVEFLDEGSQLKVMSTVGLIDPAENRGGVLPLRFCSGTLRAPVGRTIAAGLEINLGGFFIYEFTTFFH